jgi:GT2 family glycosyltransferase
METAQLKLEKHASPTAWADGRIWHGISHLAAGTDQRPLAMPRAIVFWDGEFPVGMNISDSFDECASPTPQRRCDGARAANTPVTSVRPSSVSLVICTRDRPRELARCLSSLSGQTVRPNEVVVVDNASLTQDTQEVCRQAGVIYVREPRPGLDIARNSGARAAKNEIVAYTDDDVVLHPRWLERLAAAFDAPGIWAVTGLVLPAELATPAQWHFERYWGFGRGFQRIDFGADFLQATEKSGCPTWLIGAGASMAFRRTVFAKSGYFDERLDVGAAGCSGDSEFWHRILCEGGTCRYEPSAVAFHYHRRDWADLRKQIRAYMRGHSAALLVQYERSGRKGNLRRLFVSFPGFYFRRIATQFLRGGDPSNRLMRDEMAGLLSGIWFYMRRSRNSRIASV